MEKNFYLGSANTCYGFKNCFNNICPNGTTYILKGGPGTGKSTFMKKVGEYFEKKGESVEYFYCSSDSDSLDGVRIVKKNVAIVDGTAPHVTEATIPGVTENIVNLSEYIGKNVKRHKTQIEELLKKKAQCFSLAYNYLKCAGDLFQIEKKLSKKTNFDNELNRLLALLPKTKKNNPIQDRTLFLSFVSSDGIKSLKDKNSFKKVFLDLNYVASTDLLKRLTETLNSLNISHICFLSLFEDNRIESVYIPQIDTLISAETSPSTLKTYHQLSNFTKLAGKMVMKAKFYHKKVENFYIKSMDFDGLNKCREKIISEIERI